MGSRPSAGFPAASLVAAPILTALASTLAAHIESTSRPRYSVKDLDPGDCQLICEADERCAKSWFEEGSGSCHIEGVHGSEGLPAVEGAFPPIYTSGSIKNESLRLSTEGRRRRILLATFAAGEKFSLTQQLFDQSLELAEIQEHWKWNESSFADGEHGNWYRRHKSVNWRRGGAWKPYIIWQALRRAKWGDWVIYHDSSQYIQQGFSYSVQPLLDWLEHHRETNKCECVASVQLRQTLQHEWEQQCAFQLYSPEPRDMHNVFDLFCGIAWRIGICEPRSGAECCKELWQQPMLQHSWSIWRKNRRSARFLREWAQAATDYNNIAYLPMADQSLSGLLLYKLGIQLDIRPLWIPSLYEMAWHQNMDVTSGSMGRNDGLIFKHLNLILDALHNQKVTGRRMLWLLPTNNSEMNDDNSVRRLRWSFSTATRGAWRRSLCLPSAGRPQTSAVALSVQLWLRRTGEDTTMPWSGQVKMPPAWDTKVYEPLDVREVPRAWQQSLPRLPWDATKDIGEVILFSEGLSSALSMGSWRPDMLGLSLRKDNRLHAIAEIILLNDGALPWPRNASLCAVGGDRNHTARHAHALCARMGSSFETNCGNVDIGESVQLQLVVPLHINEVNPGWQEDRWALCNPKDNQPFGVLLMTKILHG